MGTRRKAIVVIFLLGAMSSGLASAGERIYLATLVGDTGNIYHYQPTVVHRRVYYRKRHVRKRHKIRKRHTIRSQQSRPYVYRPSQQSGYVYRSYSLMTDEKRIQKAMQGLGFYNGAINGDLNTYASRMSVKKTNDSFGKGSIPILDQYTRENLIFLGTLFAYDKTLVSGKASRHRQMQAALTLLGYYQGKIDGIYGYATKSAMRQYKESTGSSGLTLSNDEAYQLVKTAKQKVDKEISDVLEAMKQKSKANQPASAQPATATP